MRPVAVIRHARTEEAGHFATFLEAHQVPWRLIAVDRGEPIPLLSKEFSGIAMMGGPMSVNDPLPWITDECALIRDAVASDTPVIGHCLGGQLISLALGGKVSRNSVHEIGWHPVRIASDPIAEDWFGQCGQEVTVFQWHGETFSIPTGASLIASSDACHNQAFALGPHLGMQFHVEMTPELIRAWCNDWSQSYDPRRPTQATVQSPREMLERIEMELPAMRALADRLYGRWLRGLKH